MHFSELNLLPGTIYNGEMTIEKLDGISKIVSAEAIRKFLIEKDDDLVNQGHILDLD